MDNTNHNSSGNTNFAKNNNNNNNHTSGSGDVPGYGLYSDYYPYGNKLFDFERLYVDGEHLFGDSWFYWNDHVLNNGGNGSSLLSGKWLHINSGSRSNHNHNGDNHTKWNVWFLSRLSKRTIRNKWLLL
jgi:hypothetical protein